MRPQHDADRGIAEAHGGTLTLDGTGPTGTTFQFALPADGASDHSAH